MIGEQATLEKIKKSFDRINFIYGEIMQNACDDESAVAKKAFEVMINLVYNHVAIMEWYWGERNYVVFTVGQILCRTSARELSDGNTEIATEVLA